jgi:phosphate transport system permease protein
MSERHQDTLAYFVLPGASDAGDGTLDRPFPSLQHALTTIAKRGEQFLAERDGVGNRSLDIVCLDRPGGTFRLTRRPTYQFYTDVQAPADGDGSEVAPWPNLQAAVAGLLWSIEAGRLRLSPGQRLCIAEREVFTPTEREKWRYRKEVLAKYLFLLMALVLIAPVVLILSYLVVKAWPVLSPDFVFTNPANRMTAGGIWAPLAGTFFLVLLSLLLAAPIGVAAGVYLNEYAGDNWVTRGINLAVMNLAGVPSIVHALFGVGAFVLFANLGRSLLAAACTVAVMTLPVIITSSREALAAVPMSFREACWNMGASRWQTIRTIVLPNSISGILTGVILQVARAAGETAPVLLTGAAFSLSVADSGWESWVPFGLGDKFMALSMHLFTITTQVSGVSQEIQFGTAVVLIALVLVVNSLSIGLRVYLRSRKRW